MFALQGPRPWRCLQFGSACWYRRLAGRRELTHTLSGTAPNAVLASTARPTICGSASRSNNMRRDTSECRALRSADDRPGILPLADSLGRHKRYWPSMRLWDGLRHWDTPCPGTRPARRSPPRQTICFRRDTDRFVRRQVGKTPLDVGADRITSCTLGARHSRGSTQGNGCRNTSRLEPQLPDGCCGDRGVSGRNPPRSWVSFIRLQGAAAGG